MQQSFVLNKPTQSINKSFVLSQLSNSQKELLGQAVKEDDSGTKIKLSFRQVSNDDRKDVAELSHGIYDGHDYLLELFDRWISDPYRVVFGVLANEKVIGLYVLNKLRGHHDKTILMQTLRIHPKYRGLKLAQSLAEFILQWIQLNLPMVEIMRISTHYNNHASLLLHKKLGYVAKFTWGFFETAELDSLRNVLQKNFSEVDLNRKGSVIDAETFVNEVNKNKEALVPSGVFVSNYFIVDANLSALKHLENEQKIVFLKDEVEGEIALSYGDILKTSYGNEWYISVYTTSYKTFIASLIHQLEVARFNDCDWTVCFYPISFQIDLDKELKKVSETNPIVLEDKVVFLEKTLKRNQ